MRRKHRPIYYVCSAVKDNQLISLQIEAETEQLASSVFQKETEIQAQIILGAYYKKQLPKAKKAKEPKPIPQPKPIIEKKIKPRHGIKITQFFTNRGTYDGWEITYLPLSDNPNRAYVFFDKRLDGNKIPKPIHKTIEIKDIVPYEKIVP